MGEDGKIFSEGQTDKIYKDMLKPLKVKISEIILYDTEKAMEFLQKYNAILRCKKDNQILSMITDLEFEIYSYEKNIGNQKAFEDKSEVIIQQIEDMKTDGDRLPLEEFEDEFLRLKQTYQTTFQKFSLEERDRIEQQLYELYGKVMVRRVREGAVDELEIPKEDESGLRIFLNNEIGRLSLNANPQVQNVIERIKFKLMDKETAFQGDEIWKLLCFAQDQERVGLNQQQIEGKKPQVTALAVANQGKEGIWSKIKRKFQKEPQLPLQIGDIGKITLDWLAQYIPQNMLEEIEDERLAKEGREKVERYLPDSKTVIYNYFDGKIHGADMQVIENDSDKYETKYEYIFTDKSGNKKRLLFALRKNDNTRSEEYSKMELFSASVCDEKKGKTIFFSDNMAKKLSIGYLIYAILLDRIFQTNLANDIAIEYGNIIENSNSRKSTYWSWGKSKIFKNLLKSYWNIERECRATISTFMRREQTNRRTFYEQTAFKERIKQTGDFQTGTIEQSTELKDRAGIEPSEEGEIK